jgi:hypothetical protein
MITRAIAAAAFGWLAAEKGPTTIDPLFLILGAFLATKNFYLPLILFFLCADITNDISILCGVLSLLTFSFSKFSPEIFLFNLGLFDYFRDVQPMAALGFRVAILTILLLLTPISPFLYDLVIILLFYNGALLKEKVIIYAEKYMDLMEDDRMSVLTVDVLDEEMQSTTEDALAPTEATATDIHNIHGPRDLCSSADAEETATSPPTPDGDD